MKTLTIYFVCLVWTLAPFATLKGIPVQSFLSGSPPAAGGYTLRDSITGTTNGSNPCGQSGTNLWAVAVQFTPTNSSITQVAVACAKSGSPTQNFRVEIWTSSSNLPGSLVGTESAWVAGSTCPSSEGDWLFYPSVSGATTGQPHFIVLRADALGTDHVLWYRISGSGPICTYNGGTWTAASTSRTSKYKTYSTP